MTSKGTSIGTSKGKNEGDLKAGDSRMEGIWVVELGGKGVNMMGILL